MSQPLDELGRSSHTHFIVRQRYSNTSSPVGSTCGVLFIF